MSDLLTTAQTAERLGISPAHVRRLIREGKLPARRFGERALMVDAADLAQAEGRPRRGWVKGRPRKPAAP